MASDKNENALREAARWYAELQDETATPDLWRRFLVWERRPENAAAFRRIEASLSTLDRARASEAAPPRRPQRHWPIGAGIAAALVLAALAGAGLLARERPQTAAEVKYATSIGEQETVTLEDGSRLVLNTASEARVRFSGRERRVELVAGQALFDVRREARPFVVAAGLAETRAIGTRFEVYLAGSENLNVTLLKGLVSVSDEEGSVLLSPGEQLRVQDGVRTVARVETARAEAWTRGMAVFTDTPLAEAVAELNRYSEVQLRVDGAIGNERISGSFRAGDQDGFVAALEALLPVVAERRDGEILLSQRQ